MSSSGRRRVRQPLQGGGGIGGGGRALRLRVHSPFHLDAEVRMSFGGNSADQPLFFHAMAAPSASVAGEGSVVTEVEVPVEEAEKKAVVEHMYELEENSKLCCFLSDLSLRVDGSQVLAAVLRIKNGFELSLALLSSAEGAVGAHVAARAGWPDIERTLCLINRMLSEGHEFLQCDADPGHPVFHQMSPGGTSKKRRKRIGLQAIRDRLASGEVGPDRACEELLNYLIDAQVTLETLDAGHPCEDHVPAAVLSIKGLIKSAEVHRKSLESAAPAHGNFGAQARNGVAGNSVVILDGPSEPVAGPSGLCRGRPKSKTEPIRQPAENGDHSGVKPGSPGTCRGRPKGASASRTDASKVDPRQQEEFRRLLDFVRNALPGVQEDKADKIALEAVGMPQRNIELSFDELWDLNVGGSMAPPSPLPEVEGGGASSSAPATVEAEADSSGIAAGPPSSGDESGSRSRTGTPTPSSSSYGSVGRGGFRLHRRVPSRYYEHFDPITQFIRVAEGAFLRTVGGGAGGAAMVPGMLDPTQAIRHIDYLENKKLEDQFNKAKQRLKLKGSDDRELLLFHNSAVEDLDAVLRNNFVFRDDGSRGEVVRLPGRGIHFSEFPNVALGFGNGLILCRVLPGRVQTSGHTLDVNKYDSLRHDSTTSTSGSNGSSSSSSSSSWDDPAHAVVVRNTRHILPFCVVRLNRDMAGESVGKMVEVIRKRLAIKQEAGDGAEGQQDVISPSPRGGRGRGGGGRGGRRGGGPPPPSATATSQTAAGDAAPSLNLPDPVPCTSSSSTTPSRAPLDMDIKVLRKMVSKGSKRKGGGAPSPSKQKEMKLQIPDYPPPDPAPSSSTTSRARPATEVQQEIQTSVESLRNFPEVRYRTIIHRFPYISGQEPIILHLPDTYLGNQVLRNINLLHDTGILFETNPASGSVVPSVESLNILRNRDSLTTKNLRQVGRDLKQYLAEKGIE